MKYYLWNKDTDAIEETEDSKQANDYLGSEDKVVGSTEIKGLTVSTVCLGIEHSFGRPGDPIIFETMVFDLTNRTNSYKDLYMERYRYPDEARKGHAKAVEMVKKGKIKNT